MRVESPVANRRIVQEHIQVMDRETVAYGIIALVGVLALGGGFWSLRRHRRLKLRRRGIKRYGH